MKFALGNVLATPGALRELVRAGVSLIELLARHACGDWGDLSRADKATNDAALLRGDRILSAYMLRTGAKLYVITEWDRSATTALLTSEY